MTPVLAEGIPLESAYLALLESPVFKELERYSAQFLAAHRAALGYYMDKWVPDPLHQWSRQWEYPFVYDRAHRVLRDRSAGAVLDAGSGITFLPYYLRTRFPNVRVCCGDYDDKLETLYRRVNAAGDAAVDFTPADLRALPYGDGGFDLVYCISVLEHTDRYETIIREFHRVLRPGGTLVVTFDVSLDGALDISVPRGVELLNALVRVFGTPPGGISDLAAQAAAEGIFTIHTAYDLNPTLLPWKYPTLQRLMWSLGQRRLAPWPPGLTVCCVTLQKAG